MKEKLLSKFIKKELNSDRPLSDLTKSYSIGFEHFDFTVSELGDDRVEVKIGNDVIYVGDKKTISEEEILGDIKNYRDIAIETARIIEIFVKEFGNIIDCEAVEGEVRIRYNSETVFSIRYGETETSVIYSGSLYDVPIPYDYSTECRIRLLTLMAEKIGIRTKSSEKSWEKALQELKGSGYECSAIFKHKNLLAVGEKHNVTLGDFNVLGEYSILIDDKYSLRKKKEREDYSLVDLIDTFDFIENLAKEYGGNIKTSDRYIELFIKDKGKAEISFFELGFIERASDEVVKTYQGFLLSTDQKKLITNKIRTKYGANL